MLRSDVTLIACSFLLKALDVAFTADNLIHEYLHNVLL
jgi:hypothetical protein